MGSGAPPRHRGLFLHAPKPVWAETAQSFLLPSTSTVKKNQQQNPGLSSGFCTWVTYHLVSNHIPWLLSPRSSVSLSHFASLTSYRGSGCAPLIKLELDKPDNSQLTPGDRGKCSGKIMMREREREKQEWRTFFVVVVEYEPWAERCLLILTSVLLDSLQIDRKTQLARRGNAKIWCVCFRDTAQAHRL